MRTRLRPMVGGIKCAGRNVRMREIMTTGTRETGTRSQDDGKQTHKVSDCMPERQIC